MKKYHSLLGESLNTQGFRSSASLLDPEKEFPSDEPFRADSEDISKKIFKNQKKWKPNKDEDEDNRKVEIPKKDLNAKVDTVPAEPNGKPYFHIDKRYRKDRHFYHQIDDVLNKGRKQIKNYEPIHENEIIKYESLFIEDLTSQSLGVTPEHPVTINQLKKKKRKKKYRKFITPEGEIKKIIIK